MLRYWAKYICIWKYLNTFFKVFVFYLYLSFQKWKLFVFKYFNKVFDF